MTEPQVGSRKKSYAMTMLYKADSFVDAMGLEGLQPMHSNFFFRFSLYIRHLGKTDKI
jgi:hypothetical protein